MTSWNAREYRDFFKRTLPHLGRRAENKSETSLEATFVELADLHAQLTSAENQIVYGRRGTGKTHAFSHLRSKLVRSREDCLLIDLRTVGSAGGYYLGAEDGRRLAAAHIMVDLIEAIHDQLYAIALRLLQDGAVYEPLIKAVDRIAEAAVKITVEGVVERSVGRLQSGNSGTNSALHVGYRSGIVVGQEANERQESTSTYKQTGTGRPTLIIGELQQSVAAAISGLPEKRLWLLFDEWSAIPLDIQPLIADFVRRVFLPCKGLILKIAAVERRSNLWQQSATGYVGLEPGADIFTGLDLDEYITRLLTPTHPDVVFYRTLLIRHVQEMAREGGLAYNFQSFDESAAINDAIPGFPDAIYFSGGNPRDLLSIVSEAATQSRGAESITFAAITRAARRHYLQTKESQANLLPSTRNLCCALRDYSAVGGRRFLVDRHHCSIAVYDLLDQRLIHLLDRSVGPGGKYDIYAIDLSMCADGLADKGDLKASDNPWANWDHVKVGRKVAPILSFDDHKATWD